MNAAFALNAFEHNSANASTLLFEQSFERVNIVYGRAHKATGQRLKCLLLCRLSRCGKRGKRTTMEAAIKDDDSARSRLKGLLCLLVRRTSFASFLLGAFAHVQARQLDCALVGFCTGVGKERLPRLGSIGIPAIKQRRKLASKLTTALDVVIVAYVHKAFGLLLQSIDNCRVAVAQAADADTRNEVEVAIAVGVFDHHSLSRNKLDRLAPKGMHDVLRFKFLLFS